LRPISRIWIWPISIAGPSRRRIAAAIPRSRRPVSCRAIIWPPRLTISRAVHWIVSWRTIIRRTIAPIATVSRTACPPDGSRTIPVIRGTIRISPSAPDGPIVIDAMRSPIPTPSAPSPRAVVDQKRADCDPRAKSDHRRRTTRAGTDVNHSGIVLRHIHNLRTGRLNYVNCLVGRRLLHFHLHL
jgi:hypothetical protein